MTQSGQETYSIINKSLQSKINHELFMELVLMISSIVVSYRVSYMERDKFIYRFFIIVIIFIISILLMIIRVRFFRILFEWDLLGSVSHYLIIYYQNYKSYNSDIVIVLSNRIDVINYNWIYDYIW